MTIKEEILQGSLLEHTKVAKELAYILPLQHPKRIKIEEEINKIIEKLKYFQKK